MVGSKLISQNQNSLWLSFSGRIFCGEPVPTSPENTLARSALVSSPLLSFSFSRLEKFKASEQSGRSAAAKQRARSRGRSYCCALPASLPGKNLLAKSQVHF